MRKRLHLLLIVAILAGFMGCSWLNLNLDDTTTNRVIAYGSGRAMGFAMTSFEIKGYFEQGLRTDLMAAYDQMLADNQVEIVSSEVMLAFYNKCLGIFAIHGGDKYGLMADLSMILSLYAGDLDTETGEMKYIDPVPRIILQYFDQGFELGVMTAQNTVTAYWDDNQIQHSISMLRSY